MTLGAVSIVLELRVGPCEGLAGGLHALELRSRGFKRHRYLGRLYLLDTRKQSLGQGLDGEHFVVPFRDDVVSLPLVDHFRHPQCFGDGEALAVFFVVVVVVAQLGFEPKLDGPEPSVLPLHHRATLTKSAEPL